MACGCSKNRGMRNTTRNPVVGPRPVANQPRIQPTVTAQAVPPASPVGAAPFSDGLDQERLRVEKLRREAIRRALNR